MGVPRLERYEIVGELGQGGMSVVYRARDRQLPREVAVKVLHEFLARQEDARRRLHREAVACAKLHHRGIVEIFDYSGPDADPSFIVTELIEGETLRDRVERLGPPRLPELAALIAVELTRALRHAHERGIIHRDLKPENVMITADGQLKLMDFGIAQIMGGATRLTTTGTLLGSPAHMAPEVIDGQLSDHRSDIFSLGTILYWLLTGRLPFAAPNPSALFRQILEGSYEPPQALAPRLGNGLARIVERALARSPEERHQDVSELEAELEKELEEVGLVPADSLARSFLNAWDPFTAELEPKLVAELTKSGREALAEGNVGRAMDRFNRVLAIEPEHPEVRALVARVSRKRDATKRLRQGVIAASVSSAAALAGWASFTWFPVVFPDGLPGRTAQVEPALAAVSGARPIAAALAPEGPSEAREAAPRAPAEAPPPAAPVVGPPMIAAAPERLPPSPRPPAAEGLRRELRPAPATSAVGAPARIEPSPPDPAAERRSEGPSGQSAPADPSRPPEAPAAPREAAAAPPEAAAAPPEAKASLVVRLGGGWADIHLDAQVARGVPRASFELAPGRHRLEIKRPTHGQHRPRTLEVTPEGRIYEVTAEGKRHPVIDGLSFVIPRDRDEAEKLGLEGWTWF